MWDYLYSADAGYAMYLLGEKGVSGKTYCIGGGTARPLREYIEAIRDAAAPGAEIGFGEIPYQEKQVMYLCADISDLEKDTEQNAAGRTERPECAGVLQRRFLLHIHSSFILFGRDSTARFLRCA